MGMLVAALGNTYKILHLLGRGGMVAVFEARHKRTGRRVAIKVMSRILHPGDPRVRRFQLEARVAGSIESEHIARVLGFGQNPVTLFPFIIMEHLAGEDLQSLIDQVGSLPVDLALRIVAQACLGLEEAHKMGVVHRDIKPANLFLARREDDPRIVVKLLDFGIAKIKSEIGLAAPSEEIVPAEGLLDRPLSVPPEQLRGRLTHTRGVLGSPFYMSPEQVRGEEGTDHRTDIWSLGIVLYCILTGLPPSYMGQAPGAEPKPIRELASWVPENVAAIVHRAAAALPEDRFQSAEAMFSAIQPLLRDGHELSEQMFVRLGRQQTSALSSILTTTETHTATGPEVEGLTSSIFHDEAIRWSQASRESRHHVTPAIRNGEGKEPPDGAAIQASRGSLNSAAPHQRKQNLLTTAMYLVTICLVLVMSQSTCSSCDPPGESRAAPWLRQRPQLHPRLDTRASHGVGML